MNDRISISLLFAAMIFAFSPSRSLASTGKSIFIDNKCASCHSIESQGIARTGSGTVGGIIPPDLSSVGQKHSASWMQGWLRKEEELNGKKHLKKFGGSDEDLKTLTTWLASLRGSAKSKAEATPKPKPQPKPEPKPDTSAKVGEPTLREQKTDSSIAKPKTLDTATPPLVVYDTMKISLPKIVIVFAIGKAELNSTAETQLGYVISDLQAEKKTKVKIIGSAYKTESKAKSLAKSRATIVRKYLIDHGISAKRLTTGSSVAPAEPEITGAKVTFKVMH